MNWSQVYTLAWCLIITQFISSIFWNPWFLKKPYSIFIGNFMHQIIFHGLGCWPITQKRNTLLVNLSLGKIRILCLWITSNFEKATFIEGVLKFGMIIFGLIHRKFWIQQKSFSKLDFRNWAMISWNLFKIMTT